VSGPGAVAPRLATQSIPTWSSLPPAVAWHRCGILRPVLSRQPGTATVRTGQTASNRPCRFRGCAGEITTVDYNCDAAVAYTDHIAERPGRLDLPTSGCRWAALQMNSAPLGRGGRVTSRAPMDTARVGGAHAGLKPVYDRWLARNTTVDLTRKRYMEVRAEDLAATGPSSTAPCSSGAAADLSLLPPRTAYSGCPAAPPHPGSVIPGRLAAEASLWRVGAGHGSPTAGSGASPWCWWIRRARARPPRRWRRWSGRALPRPSRAGLRGGSATWTISWWPDCRPGRF
jgi:hypothetical protein